jgi:hypothetical protein
MRYMIGVAIIMGTLAVALLNGCTIRKYEVKVYATEGSHVNISPEILAEVPHTTTVQTEAEVDLPDANVIGK